NRELVVAAPSATEPNTSMKLSTDSDPGSARLLGLSLDEAPGSESVDNFIEVFGSVALGAATTSSLFSYSGAVFLTLQTGEVVRLGSPLSRQAGDDSAASGSGPFGTEASSGASALSLMGWRQLF
ncbi:MAG: hypothetical protein AAGC55_07520, partial [Myxococcota bacterium]